jgi:hypothetical protein
MCISRRCQDCDFKACAQKGIPDACLRKTSSGEIQSKHEGSSGTRRRHGSRNTCTSCVPRGGNHEHSNKGLGPKRKSMRLVQLAAASSAPNWQNSPVPSPRRA